MINFFIMAIGLHLDTVICSRSFLMHDVEDYGKEKTDVKGHIGINGSTTAFQQPVRRRTVREKNKI
jgi:hypothetical protein